MLCEGSSDAAQRFETLSFVTWMASKKNGAGSSLQTQSHIRSCLLLLPTHPKPVETPNAGCTQYTHACHCPPALLLAEKALDAVKRVLGGN